jgi:hypothetical protein
MIPVHSVTEIDETFGSLGFSYVSHSFGDGKRPKRMTYIPVRDRRGFLISMCFVPAEVL